MPLPDKHANEPTVELDSGLYLELQNAKAAVDAWTKRYNQLKDQVRAQIGDAYAATVNGAKVLAYRPQVKYAEAALIKAYPELTEHFFELKVENTFNIDKFREAHPDIAEQYRVRALTEVKGA